MKQSERASERVKAGRASGSQGFCKGWGKRGGQFTASTEPNTLSTLKARGLGFRV